MEFKSTTIVPQAEQYQRVKWNEFPEEEQKERQQVPRVHAQEWVPENEVEHPVQKTNYQPGRITRAWPPPGYGVEEQIQIGLVMIRGVQKDHFTAIIFSIKVCDSFTHDTFQ